MIDHPYCIDIELDNPSDYISEFHADICNVYQHDWLQIDTSSFNTTNRSSGFRCSIGDLKNGCVRLDLTVVSDLIDPGTGPIAKLSYNLDADAPLEDSAYLNPQNIDIRDDTHSYAPNSNTNSLSVTPKPGRVGLDGCEAIISPSSLTVSSEGAIQFNASNPCYYNPPSYTWSVSSTIGSTIND